MNLGVPLAERVRKEINRLSPVGYWPLIDDATNIAAGYEGQSNGVITEALPNQPGLIDNAFSFDGSNDFIDLGSSSNLITGAGSLSFGCLAYFPTTAANRFPLASRTSASTEGYDILVGSGGNAGNVTVRCRDASGNTADATNYTSTATNWHFVVGVIDRVTNLLYLYVDGVERKTVSVATLTDSIGNSQNLYVGKRGSTFWNSKVQHVFIVRRAITAAEVLKIAETMYLA